MPQFYIFRIFPDEMTLMLDAPVKAESREEAIRTAIDQKYARNPAPAVQQTDSMGEYAAAKAEHVQHFVEVWDDE